MMDVAGRRDLPQGKVTFGVADIYNFPGSNTYENLFGGFIWSHVRLQDLDKFLKTVNELVVFGGTVVFMDNNFCGGEQSSHHTYR